MQRFRRVDVLVEIQHQVVSHDAVAGGEKRDQPLDEVPLGGLHSRPQVGDVGREIDFVNGPGVLDGRLEHFEEDRVLHGTKSEIESGI
jgi:hypothetical protein